MILKWIGFLGAAIFIGFFVFSILTGQKYLSIQHAISSSLWLYALSLLKKDKPQKVILIFLAVSILSVLFVSIVMGWKARFYYYLLAIMLILLFHPQISKTGSITVILTTAVLYFTLYYFFYEGIAPLQNKNINEFLHFFNSLTAASLIGGVVYYFRRSSNSLEEKLRIAANTDILTGLLNRRSMNYELERHSNLRQRHGLNNALVLIDIDHFKSINDKYGHNVGDDVLKQFADVLSTRFRQEDIISRWGGEEFLILMPFTHVKDAVMVTEGLRKNIEKHTFASENQTIPVTFTAGVAPLIPAKPIEEALNQVDKYLYQGKDLGRNRVVTGQLENI